MRRFFARVDSRFLRNAVQPYVNAMEDSPCRNFDAAMTPIDHKRSGPDTFQSVAQTPSRWTDVVGIVGNADIVVQGTPERLGGQSRTVVLHFKSIVADADLNRRHDVGFFTSIQGIVDQFL
jgi:hypothetical protein